MKTSFFSTTLSFLGFVNKIYPFYILKPRKSAVFVHIFVYFFKLRPKLFFSLTYRIVYSFIKFHFILLLGKARLQAP